MAAFSHAVGVIGNYTITAGDSFGVVFVDNQATIRDGVNSIQFAIFKELGLKKIEPPIDLGQFFSLSPAPTLPLVSRFAKRPSQ